MTTQTQELSVKKKLLQSLLRCPHRDLAQTIPIFSQAMEEDPLFAGKCCYALTLQEFNKIRDLGEAGISFLLTSQFPEHRIAGRILFQDLEPYRAARAANFVRRGLKPNRQAKSAVTRFIRTLEGDQRRFDGAVRVARKPIHQMYVAYHIKPSGRAQTIVFLKKTPEGEIDIDKLLREAGTPEDQARIISEHRVPYRKATSALKKMTPAVWVALIDVMSPVEAVNARAAVERSGVLEDKRIRALYEDKLAQAKDSERVTAIHLVERKSARGSDERLEAIVQETRQDKVEKGGRITAKTLFLIDRSGSMHTAIELAKRLCPMAAASCDDEMAVYCFNDTAVKLEYSDNTLKEFERAFRMIKSGGQTSIGIGLQKAIRDGFIPEQVIIVTDQGENSRPYLSDEYLKLIQQGEETRFIFVTVPSPMFGPTDKVVKELESKGAEVVDYRLDTDMNTSAWYVDMENVVPLLTKGGYIEIVERIMELELPA